MHRMCGYGSVHENLIKKVTEMLFQGFVFFNNKQCVLLKLRKQAIIYLQTDGPSIWHFCIIEV